MTLATQKVLLQTYPYPEPQQAETDFNPSNAKNAEKSTTAKKN